MKKNNRKIFIIGAIIIAAILLLLIPTIRQGKDLTSSENDREDVLYDGNTEDTPTNQDTTSTDSPANL